MSIRKLKQNEVNNADFLIVDNLNISGSDVSNEVYYNNKTITRPKNNTNLNVFIVSEIASVSWGKIYGIFPVIYPEVDNTKTFEGEQ